MGARCQVTNDIPGAEPGDQAPSGEPSVARLLYSASEDGVFVVLRPAVRTGALGNGPRGAFGEGELTASLAIIGLDIEAKRFWRREFAGRASELREAVISLLSA